MARFTVTARNSNEFLALGEEDILAIGRDINLGAFLDALRPGALPSWEVEVEEHAYVLFRASCALPDNPCDAAVRGGQLVAAALAAIGHCPDEEPAIWVEGSRIWVAVNQS